ncbi:MAG: hypothetical protein KDD35_05190 [Bdellovibrionales bacterium]|nr:hypothetical protein [Bdellovibrionales bacterium]
MKNQVKQLVGLIMFLCLNLSAQGQALTPEEEHEIFDSNSKLQAVMRVTLPVRGNWKRLSGALTKIEQVDDMTYLVVTTECRALVTLRSSIGSSYSTDEIKSTCGVYATELPGEYQ